MQATILRAGNEARSAEIFVGFLGLGGKWFIALYRGFQTSQPVQIP